MARASKPLTPAALRRYAINYLNRYATTTAHLRMMMRRRVDKSVGEHGGDRGRALRWVDEYLAELTAAGVLDDARYAADRARSLAEAGHSRRSIRAKLAAKRVPAEIISETLDGLGRGGDAELEAAARYVRRRRLGAYRDEASRAAERQKDLARLARRGFSYDTAKRALDLDEERIDALVLYGER